MIGVDRAEPSGDRRLDGARYHAVDVLSDGALAALFGGGPPPWAVVNTVGGFAPHSPLTELDPAVPHRAAGTEPADGRARHQARAAPAEGQPTRAAWCTPPAGPRW